MANRINENSDYLKDLLDKSAILSIKKKFESVVLGRQVSGVNQEFLSQLLFLIEDESLSISYLKTYLSRPELLSTTIRNNIAKLYSLKKDGDLPTKSLSLYQQFNIKVYTETYRKEKELKIMAYKNIDNICKEVKKIRTFVYGDTILLPTLSEPSDLAYEFLSINDRLPDMILSKRITFYSFLLNYSSSLIFRTGNYDLLNAILSLSGLTASQLGFETTNANDDTQVEANRKKWDNYGKKLYDFLAYLDENTI